MGGWASSTIEVRRWFLILFMTDLASELGSQVE